MQDQTRLGSAEGLGAGPALPGFGDDRTRISRRGFLRGMGGGVLGTAAVAGDQQVGACECAVVRTWRSPSRSS